MQVQEPLWNELQFMILMFLNNIDYQHYSVLCKLGTVSNNVFCKGRHGKGQ
jgi:CDGSH-type Zn-finger protein